MSRPRRALAHLWNMLPLPFGSMAAEVREAGAPRPGGVPLNKICDVRDGEDAAWRRCHEDLGQHFDPARLHRKEWEFAHGLYGLRALGCLAPEATALGLGCGHEPFMYFLARRLRQVVATDLYEGDFQGREADPRILTDPGFYAPFSYPRERLVVRRMDATRIDYPDEHFDVVFSFSSIEHFGSRRDQARSLAEIRRVLRPGGVAALTTEMILNRLGFHGDYFRPADLLRDLVPRSGLRLAGGAFDFSTSRETFAGLVTLPRDAGRLPHLVLRWRNTYFTSCALFLERPAPPGCAEDRLARRGEERDADLPPLLCARFTLLEAPETVRAGAGFTLRLAVENRGTMTWSPAAPDGTGHVQCGAHLRGGDGAPLVHDYGRAPLPGPVAPGGTADVELRLAAPAEPGSYTVEVDMVREGIAWFASRGESPEARLPLAVR